MTLEIAKSYELKKTAESLNDTDTLAYRVASTVVVLNERNEKAKAMLAYFGPQGANVIAVLEGTDA